MSDNFKRFIFNDVNLSVFFIMFLMKITGYVTWSWAVITLPITFPAITVACTFIVVGISMISSALNGKKK